MPLIPNIQKTPSKTPNIQNNQQNKKKIKTQKKVIINLRKNKFRQIIVNNQDDISTDKMKKKPNTLIFDDFPDIKLDELMNME